MGTSLLVRKVGTVMRWQVAMPPRDDLAPALHRGVVLVLLRYLQADVAQG
jgi:hypothetical protein